MNLKPLLNLHTLSLLMIALVLSACGGSSGTQTLDNNTAPQSDSGDEENPEANKGTYALKMKTGEEYYNTLLSLTGFDPAENITQYDGSGGSNDQELRDAYLVAQAGLPRSSDPGQFSAGAAKDIMALASAFCQEASLDNDERRDLFSEESIFYIGFNDTDYDEFLASEEVYDEVFDTFANAYWAGQGALSSVGSALPFYAATKAETRELVQNLADQRPGDVSKSQMMKTLMVTTCTSILASANVYLH